MIACTLGFANTAHAAPETQPPPDGAVLFAQNCATCHGADATGDRKSSDIGFPIKMPDFTDCEFANSEADTDWLSSIHRGGRARGFPRLMPAFDQALSEDEINAILGYLRAKCAKSPWPRGDLNFPLAMYTEKAFPEDEVYNITNFNTNGAHALTSTTILEKRFGPTSQLELDLPLSSIASGPGMRTYAGIGDVTVGLKQNLLADVDQGTIFSVMPEVVVPTGDAAEGLGQGRYSFQAHALFDQAFGDYFLQSDLWGSYASSDKSLDQANLYFSFGRTFAEDDGWGRAWTPQLEFLSSRDFAPGAKLDWDVVPQLQVTLSARQHILASIGERFPLNDTSPQHEPEFLFYVIWDWYDAGLLEGW